MGTARQRAERLAEKLLRVRLALGLSQTEMLRRLNAEEMVAYTRISEYERGIREPPLPILLRYARAASVPTEVLIDDELDLPAKLPGPTNHEEIKRKFALSRKRR
jgi:transcriptional regulator with XRE-family HTH domain